MADDESPYEWDPAGHLQAGEEFNDGYHNFEAEGFTDWDFLPDADYVVLHFHDDNTGEDFYATFAGPFDDYDDLEAAIAEWDAEGS